MFSKEHTQSGHSEFQDAILNKLDAGGYKIDGITLDGIVYTVIVDPSNLFGCSFQDGTSGSDAEVCEKMNEFLARAHWYFFGTEFDGSGE